MNKVKQLSSDNNKIQKNLFHNETEIRDSSHKNIPSQDKNIKPIEEDTYNEEEQARLFKEAIENFRKPNQTPSSASEIIGKELGTSSENLDPNSSMLPANRERSCCWNCLKMILAEGSIHHVFEEKIMKLKVVMT
jgi:hypothetical protein